MIDYDKSAIIILPHLDDEFALLPIFKNFLRKKTFKNLKIIYCCERNSSNKKLVIRRRIDNQKALSLYGIRKKDIIYINDSFNVEDNLLYKKMKKIYVFLENFLKLNNYAQLFTLDFEGGHPDHDTLALLIDKLCKKYKIKVFFFPAYNYRKTLFFPYSVLRPLEVRESSAIKIKSSNLCWMGILRIAYIYSTERSAFLFLMPIFIFKAIFSRYIIYFDHIDIFSVDWFKSLTYKRYKVDLDKINSQIMKI